MLLDKVRGLIADQMGLPVDQVKAESRFIEDLGADSLDLVEMLMTVESEWGLLIDDDDMKRFTTVESVVNYIAEKTE